MRVLCRVLMTPLCAALASLGLLAQPPRSDKQSVYSFSHNVAAMLPLAQLVRSRGRCSAKQRLFLLTLPLSRSLCAPPQSVEVAQSHPGTFTAEDEARARCIFRHAQHTRG